LGGGGGITCILSYFIAKIKNIYKPSVSSKNMKGETAYENWSINITVEKLV